MRNTSYKFGFRVLLFLFVLSGAHVTNAQIDQSLQNKIRLAQTYEAAGQLDKAEQMYRELLAAQPTDNFYFESLNRLLVAQKKYEQSIRLLQQKIKQTPGDYNLYGLLGSTYYIMDQTQKAYEAWESGIAINPDSYISYRVMANYAIENRAFDKAIDILKRGQQHSNDPIIFSMDLANIYAANMRFTDAAKEFCNMISKNALQLQAVKNRMTAYLSRPDAAAQTIEVVKDFAESSNQKEFFDLLSFVYQTVQNYKEAFNAVTEAEKKFNGNGTGVFVFAQDAYRNRKYEWAADAYNFILKNYPNSPYMLTSELGYARTMEAALDQKFEEQSESWKPIAKPVLLFTDEYTKIISAYQKFINTYKNNPAGIEALFRIAEIYRNRILDYSKADETYGEIINAAPASDYAAQSFIARGKIALHAGDLENAKVYFEKVSSFKTTTPDNLSLATYMLAKIEFWKGKFAQSLSLLKQASQNMSADFANDALELSSLIVSTKKDSINLVKYAEADLDVIQNKLQDAAIEFKTLADNQNLFILNDFAKIKLAEIYIAEDNFSDAVKTLTELSENEKTAIFDDKAAFLLARCYEFGIKDLQKASQIFEKLLENFPNSLYFDRARDELNKIQTKNG